MEEQAIQQIMETQDTTAFCMHDIDSLNQTRENRADMLFTRGTFIQHDFGTKSMPQLFNDTEKLMLIEQKLGGILPQCTDICMKKGSLEDYQISFFPC